MNSIIALVYLSVAVILIVFGVKQIKNKKYTWNNKWRFLFKWKITGYKGL